MVITHKKKFIVLLCLWLITLNFPSIQVSKKENLAETTRDILLYVMRDLSHKVLFKQPTRKNSFSLISFLEKKRQQRQQQQNKRELDVVDGWILCADE